MYELIAPLSDVLDALTVLSPAQYWSTFATCAVAFALLALRRPLSVRVCLRAGLRLLCGTIAVVGLLLVAKRPMASLALGDPDLLAVDFHSHTSASHDGRAGFDAEHNRDWHAASGFDVAYVTDHRTFDGALEGSKANPALAGAGMVLLPGVELRATGEHPILIGVDPRRMRIESPDWRDAAIKADGGPAPPLVFLALPGNLLRIPHDLTDGPVRLGGIEISDGSPRGIAQSATDRQAVLALAQKLDVALIAASDNHGWGRAAPAWSVMRIPGWLAMSPAALDIAIRRTILLEGRHSVQVISRRLAAEPVGAAGFVLGGAGVAWVMLRTMSLPERISWLAWTWMLCLAHLRFARTNRRGLRVRVQKRTPARRPIVKAAA